MDIAGPGASAPSGGAPAGAPAAPSAPAGGGTPASSRGTPNAPAGSPRNVQQGGAPRGAPARVEARTEAPAGEAGADAGAPAGETAAAKAKRLLWKRTLEDGTEAEHDLTDYRHKVKLKEGDREVEREASIEELARGYERTKTSMKRFEEAAEIRKQAAETVKASDAREQRIVETLQNPKTALALVKRALGEKAFLEAINQEVMERMDYDRMTPAQRTEFDRRREAETAAERRARELDEREARIKQGEKAESERQMKQAVEKAKGEVSAALTAAKLPVTGTTIALVAERMAMARRTGAPLTLDEAVADTREELRGYLGEFAKDPATLKDLLGENAEALRAAELEELREQPGRRAPGEVARGRPRAAPVPVQTRQNGKPVYLEDFARKLRGGR